MSTWPKRTLGDIVDFFSGYAWKAARFSDENFGIPIIRIQNVDAVRQSEFAYWLDDYDPRFLIDKGDILLTLSGSFRAEIWQGPRALLNQRIVKITPKAAIDRNWLLHSLRGALVEIEAMGRHALVNNVALSDLKDMQLACPPLEEQKRIAEILDEVDALRRKRQRALARLNQLGQAIFIDMFGDLGGGVLNLEPLGLLTSKIGSGATPKGGDSAYKAEGTPLIRSMNVHDDQFTEKGLAFIDEKQAAKLDNVIVNYGDVLLNITGASVARVCTAPATMNGARVNQHVSIIRPTERLSSVFLAAYLLLPSIKKKLLTIAESGATRQAITKSQIEQLTIPVPPRQKQEVFAQRIGIIKGYQDKVTAHSAGLESLFPALQHRAFRGEL